MRIRYIVALLGLGMAGLGWTDPVPVEPQEPAAQVSQLLAPLTPGDSKTEQAVEDALVAAGPALESAMKARIAAERTAGEKAPADEAAPAQAARLARVRVLEEALTRLTWGWPPREAIHQWLRRLRDAEGDPFQTIVRPVRLLESTFTRAFPNRVWYGVRFEKATALPAPLQPMNIFFVHKDGRVQQVSDSKELEGLFRDTLQPVTEEDEERVSDIVGAWLQLSGALLAESGGRMVVAPKGITVAYRESAIAALAGWRAAGMATLTGHPQLTGTISVEMGFDIAGTLKSATEMRQLTRLSEAVPTPEGPGTPAPPPAPTPPAP
jgi:hypothetical protein